MDSSYQEFEVVGIERKIEKLKPLRKKNPMTKKGIPYLSMGILTVILFSCLCAELLMNHNPTYLNLAHFNVAPNRDFYFGTDTLGRDIFSIIWYGGRISLFIGIFSTMISTSIALLYGAISGIASKAVDNVMMRFDEMLLSIPNILFILFVQGIVGKKSIVAISFVIGITSWMTIAKVIRTEVIQIRKSEYITASKSMGADFLFILRKHLVPNCISSIMYMVVMNLSNAIVVESILSFFGIGLPPEIISWGSMLSLADRALLSNSWWIILIPGTFLITTIICITNIGEYLRKRNTRRASNL